MKTTLLLTFSILLTLTGISQTQDWRPIRTDDTYFYFGNGEYRAYRIDSIQEFPNSTILFSFPELFASTQDDCFNPFGPSWIGSRIEIAKNKTTIYNIINEPITLLNTTKIGTKWHLYDYSETRFIQAEIIGKTYENIGYTEDSVVNIELSSDDGLNGSNIKISKNHGIVQGFNFLLFPELSTEFQHLAVYTLTGQVSNTTSKGNLTEFDVYNFEIGDELHTSYYSYSVISDDDVQITNEKYIKKVVDKNYNQDSSEVTYTFNQCDKNGMHLIKETILLNVENFELLPFQALKLVEEYTLTFNQLWNHSNSYRYKIFGSGYMYYTDSCYSFIYIDKKKSNKLGAYPYPHEVAYYVEGLGGPYYNHDFMFSGTSYNLVYYKKGNLQWGTPYNCDDLLISIDIDNKFDFKLYPNPATNQITVELPNLTELADISIIDLFGKICLKTQLTETMQEINITHLAQGIYLYQIKLPGGDVKIGKIIKN